MKPIVEVKQPPATNMVGRPYITIMYSYHVDRTSIKSSKVKDKEASATRETLVMDAMIAN